jgi:hypothetical protein
LAVSNFFLKTGIIFDELLYIIINKKYLFFILYIIDIVISNIYRT